MKVLDASFLIDYLHDVDAATSFLTANADEEFVIPLPAFAEAVAGEGNRPGESHLVGIQNALEWATVYDLERRHAVLAGEITDEIPPGGPYLAGCDALIAAVGRDLGAPVVTADSDLTHPVVTSVLEIEEYR